MTEQAHRQRDARLRWQLLQLLHGNLANHHGGWVSLRFLHDALGGFGLTDQTPEDLGHTLTLARDLVARRFVLEEDNREDRDQVFTDHVTFKLDADGVRFIDRDLPPDRGIDDGRRIKP